MLDMTHITSMTELTAESAKMLLNFILFGGLLLLLTYEFFTGKYSSGKRTSIDWQMTWISFAMVALVQRPIVYGTCFLLMGNLLPWSIGEFRYFNQEHFIPCLIGFLMLDEFLHGGTHYFSHAKTPNNKLLASLQKFIKRAHRPHHLHGSGDNKGEMSAAHSPVEGWAFLFILPNYWFGAAILYLGWIEVFLVGNLIKTFWVFHVHTNWNYDLYFLNHKNKYIRKSMYALCHIFTFPTQHHQHHSRSKNSAKNMQNFLAVFDWLLWGTLVIENKRPEIYGWRQAEKESRSALYRYFAND